MVLDLFTLVALVLMMETIPSFFPSRIELPRSVLKAPFRVDEVVCILNRQA
jgi:hypothetical protein